MRHFNRFTLIALFFLSFARAPHVFAQVPGELSSTESKIVKAIEVQGNKTISIATILSKTKTRVGQQYRQAVISDDLKRLYNTGYFSDVRVDKENFEDGFKVIILVEEKPVVEEITFSKTRHVKSKAIKKKLKTHEGKFLDKKFLNDDVKTIKELYEKKGLTNVEVEVESFVDEVTNKVSLHFVIREGFKVRIKRINIYGNNSFKDKKIRKVLKTKEKWLFIHSGYLKEDVLEEDMDRIKAFYEQEGYIDAVIKHNVEYLYQGWIEINVQIEEGKRYRVGSLEISGNQVISKKEILRVMEEIEVSNIFSREKLSLDISNIRTLYFDRGYIFARVVDSASLDSKTGEVQVKIDIQEGGVAYIEEVKIQGNTRTRDIVIRRELNMYPGDRFDGEKLRRSKEKLNNLGYFEDVAFDIEDTDTMDRKDLVVQVKEAKTGTFSFGGGFSTVDRVVGFIEIEQRNFDWKNWPSFTGGGQHLSLRAETGSSRTNYRLSFTEPWIFDHPVSGGFDVYRTERDREDDTGYAYDEERTGGGVRFGKRFTEYVTGNVSYNIENVDISNFASGVSADLLAEGGENLVSKLGFSVARDTRNSVFNPTKGYIARYDFDVAGGVIGGDKDFVRSTISTSYYVPFKWNSVLELRLRAGVVNDFGDSTRVPIFERYFAGGARSIRGYEERDVGPLDPQTLDPVGGESMVVANIEYTIPVIEFIKLAAFFDTGNVWSDVNDFGSGDFKSGVGLGLRVKTPIGPVSLDYGYPLDDVATEADKEGKFYFSVSRGF